MSIITKDFMIIFIDVFHMRRFDLVRLCDSLVNQMTRILRSNLLAKLAIKTTVTKGVLPLDSITSYESRGSSIKTTSSVTAVKVGKGMLSTTQSTRFGESFNPFRRITRSMTRESRSLAPACTVEVQGTFFIVFQLYIIN
jgi:hypothetical protein